MQLQALLGPETKAPPGCGGVEIAGITADSRQVQAGWLFVAIPGSKADGARFVPKAIAKGAAAVLVKDGTQVEGFQIHLGGTLSGGDATGSGFGRKVRGLKTTAEDLPDYVERVLRRFSAARQGDESFAAWTLRASDEELS